VPYPRRLLNDGEEIALDLKPHWWYFSRHVLTGVPLLVVAILLLSWSTGSDLRTWGLRLWGLLAIAWAVWLGLQYLSWQFTQFVVTNRRVIYRVGVLRRRGVEIPLSRITNINFSQGLFERLIGAGDLVIESAGASGDSRFTNVQHPDAVQQEIHVEMEREQRGLAPHERPADASGEVTRRIAELADLRDRGAITEAEYQAKKAELLDRL
jgi:uncharacterized membrane protein YdbT with pleckstrin-like domain